MNRENNRNFLEGKKYNIITFGCQMNEHDSETIAGMLEEEGCRQVLTKEESDITIINTCSIRENADKRFFGTLGQLKKNQGKESVLHGLCLRLYDAAAARDRYHPRKISMGGHHLRDA